MERPASQYLSASPVYIKSEKQGTTSYNSQIPLSYNQPADQVRRVQTSSRLSQQNGSSPHQLSPGGVTQYQAAGYQTGGTTGGPMYSSPSSSTLPIQAEGPPIVRQAPRVEPPSTQGAGLQNIDPKYVGELEAALGRLRVENANLLEAQSTLQQKNQALSQEISGFSSKNQEVNKILEENNNLKLEKSRLTEDLDSRTREFQALSEKHRQVLEQLFSSHFDKFAFDATIKDNANLREHIKGMEQLVQNLQQNFESYKRETHHIHEDNQQKNLHIAQIELTVQQLNSNLVSQTRQLQEHQQDQSKLHLALRQKDDMVKLLQSELANSVASVQKLQYVVAHGNAPSK